MILVRSALFNVVFYATTAVLTLFVGVPLLIFAPARAPALARLWARANIASLRAICGIRVVVIGREHLPARGPALIAAQHQSAFDTMVWLTLLPHCCYVLKRELVQIPLFGSLIRRAGMIPIDRGTPIAAMRQLIREGRRAKAETCQIVIFPEGSRAAPGRRLPLQPGIAALADATGLPVIPAATDSGERWGRRAFRKRPGTIHIAIRPGLEIGLRREALLIRLSAALDDGETAIAALPGAGGSPCGPVPGWRGSTPQPKPANPCCCN